jgi:hypothetical protein
MKRTLRNVALIFAALIVIVGSGTSYAAGTDGFIGVFCWKLDPFSDTIKVAVRDDGGVFQLNGRWNLGSSYTAIAGSAAADTSGLDFYYTASNLADASLPNSWFFHAKIASPTALNGTWTFKRDDGFVNNGTFTFLAACPPTATPGASAGPRSND